MSMKAYLTGVITDVEEIAEEEMTEEITIYFRAGKHKSAVEHCLKYTCYKHYIYLVIVDLILTYDMQWLSSNISSAPPAATP